jgi:hypothetical protein
MSDLNRINVGDDSIWPDRSPRMSMEVFKAAAGRPEYPVGCADGDGTPDAAGCCNTTVTQRCKGCPHVK